MSPAEVLTFLLWRAYRAHARLWRRAKRRAVASGRYVPDKRSRFGLRPAGVPPRESDDERNTETILSGG